MSNIKIRYDWDLSPLFKSVKDPEIKKLRNIVNKQSYKFINKWKNRDDYLHDPEILKIALDEYENWLKNWGEGAQEWYYLHLMQSLNSASPQIKAALNKIQEFGKKIENDIQFFTLNLAKIDKNTQTKMLKHEPLLPYKHFLEQLFAHAKYLLSDPEEKILNLK